MKFNKSVAVLVLLGAIASNTVDGIIISKTDDVLNVKPDDDPDVGTQQRLKASAHMLKDDEDIQKMNIDDAQKTNREKSKERKKFSGVVGAAADKWAQAQQLKDADECKNKKVEQAKADGERQEKDEHLDDSSLTQFQRYRKRMHHHKKNRRYKQRFDHGASRDEY